MNEGFSLESGQHSTPAEQVKQGYHKLEQQAHALRKSQFSTKQIKKAWGLNGWQEDDYQFK